MQIENLKEFLVSPQEKITGELVIKSNNQQWHLYFFMGRLFYATGGTHRVRRWYRALKRHCPNFAIEASQSPVNEPWEYELLRRGVTANHIETTQARAIIQASVQEVLFDLFGQENLSYHLQTDKPLAWRLILAHIEILIDKTYQLQMQWQKMGLVKIKADVVPIIVQKQKLQEQVSPEVFQTLVKLLTGKHSLWDVAQQMKQPITNVTRSLIPVIRQGIIKLQSLPDLPAPVPAPVPAPPTKTFKYLVACIDDSPLVGKSLEKILVPMDCKVLSILDPLRAINILLKYKPDLIFLDLMMPNTNGYELCSALRKTSVFRDTPIVILTGNADMINRVRVKMTEASHFISKPAEAAKIVPVVEKLLGITQSKQSTEPTSENSVSQATA